MEKMCIAFYLLVSHGWTIHSVKSSACYSHSQNSWYFSFWRNEWWSDDDAKKWTAFRSPFACLPSTKVTRTFSYLVNILKRGSLSLGEQKRYFFNFPPSFWARLAFLHRLIWWVGRSVHRKKIKLTTYRKETEWSGYVVMMILSIRQTATALLARLFLLSFFQQDRNWRWGGDVEYRGKRWKW